jgi:hypothetical protein
MQGPCCKRMPVGKTVLAVAMVAGLGGCHLERSVIAPPFGKVTPSEYCPGDTLTASYDFLLTETCRTGADCSGPNVDLSSSPAAFPPQRLSGFAGSLTFPAGAAPSVDVTFQADRMPVLIPTARTMPDGTVINVERSFTNPAIGRATLFTGATRVLSQDGMCAGATPAYAVSDIPGPPAVSAQARPTQVCNVSGVATIVTVTGASGTPWSVPLAVGQCMPMPAPVAAGASQIAARPQVPDPFARCSAVTGGTPPASLRTSVTLACPSPSP